MLTPQLPERMAGLGTPVCRVSDPHACTHPPLPTQLALPPSPLRHRRRPAARRMPLCARVRTALGWRSAACPARCPPARLPPAPRRRSRWVGGWVGSTAAGTREGGMLFTRAAGSAAAVVAVAVAAGKLVCAPHCPTTPTQSLCAKACMDGCGDCGAGKDWSACSDPLLTLAWMCRCEGGGAAGWLSVHQPGRCWCCWCCWCCCPVVAAHRMCTDWSATYRPAAAASGLPECGAVNGAGYDEMCVNINIAMTFQRTCLNPPQPTARC